MNEKLNNILNIVVICVYLGSFVFMLYYNTITLDRLSREVKSMKDLTVKNLLYLPDNEDKVKTVGAYFSTGDYYCVSTKDRDWKDIRLTDYHEMCHAFVNMDFDHFCSHTNQTRWNVEEYMG